VVGREISLKSAWFSVGSAHVKFNGSGEGVLSYIIAKSAELFGRGRIPKGWVARAVHDTAIGSSLCDGAFTHLWGRLDSKFRKLLISLHQMKP